MILGWFEIRFNIFLHFNPHFTLYISIYNPVPQGYLTAPMKLGQDLVGPAPMSPSSLSEGGAPRRQTQLPRTTRRQRHTCDSRIRHLPKSFQRFCKLKRKSPVQYIKKYKEWHISWIQTYLQEYSKTLRTRNLHALFACHLKRLVRVRAGGKLRCNQQKSHLRDIHSIQ